MAVYIAADRELSPVPWNDQAPAFNTAPLGEFDGVVRVQLSKPHVLYLGAHIGCSCGFNYGDVELCDEKDRDEDAAARRSVAALRSYLTDAVRGGAVELYACWEGDWQLPAEHRLEVTPAHFAGDRFRFPERAFYLVHS